MSFYKESWPTVLALFSKRVSWSVYFDVFWELEGIMLYYSYSLSVTERKLQVSRRLPAHTPVSAQQPLKVMIPCRSYSPANSESSLSSDYLSPPAVMYNVECSNHISQTKSDYQGTILPVRGGGYAVLIQNQSQHMNSMPYSGSQPTSRAVNHQSVPHTSRTVLPVWRPW